MAERTIGINIDLLIVRGGTFLLGLLTEKWSLDGVRVWGVPGSDLHFGETIGDAVKRECREEHGCSLVSYEVICVNANHAYGNHYIGIGVIAHIEGEPRLTAPDDWERWEWFTEKTIPNDLFPAAKNLLECYFSSKNCVSE